MFWKARKASQNASDKQNCAVKLYTKMRRNNFIVQHLLFQELPKPILALSYNQKAMSTNLLIRSPSRQVSWDTCCPRGLFTLHCGSCITHLQKAILYD